MKRHLSQHWENFNLREKEKHSDTLGKDWGAAMEGQAGVMPRNGAISGRMMRERRKELWVLREDDISAEFSVTGRRGKRFPGWEMGTDISKE